MNYAEMRNPLLDLMLPYGDAGRECIDNLPFILLEPNIYDPKYYFDDMSGEMSALGLVRYRSDLAKYDDRDILYKKDKLRLLSFLLLVLSYESLAALETYAEYLGWYEVVDDSVLRSFSSRGSIASERSVWPV